MAECPVAIIRKWNCQNVTRNLSINAALYDFNSVISKWELKIDDVLVVASSAILYLFIFLCPLFVSVYKGNFSLLY